MPADRGRSVLDAPGTARISDVGLMLTETRLLTEQLGAQRREARFLVDDTQGQHEDHRIREWITRTRERARSSAQAMLGELGDLGFAWRDVARMIGVSVPAVQKWRRGEGTTGENRQKVAGLLAACDLVSDHYHVSEVASWFETPVRAGTPVTLVDLWADGRPELVFEHAGDQEEPEAILDRWDADWREHYQSDFEVFTAGDGQLAVRPKRS